MAGQRGVAGRGWGKSGRGEKNKFNWGKEGTKLKPEPTEDRKFKLGNIFVCLKDDVRSMVLLMG